MADAGPGRAAVHSAAVSPRVAFVPTFAATPGGVIVAGTLPPDPTAPSPATPAFPPIDLHVVPGQWVDSRRPLPDQSASWLDLKAAGRIALVDGRFAVLPVGSDPMVNPSTSLPVPDKALLDVTWTRWIVEVPGSGIDEKHNYFSNLSYWEFCGDGAMTVALWYWQQLTGHPDVTGTAGYFLDPYAAEGVSWPTSGPSIATSHGTRLGTYWSGSDTVSGFTAHGRGFEFYLAMAAQPTGWQSTGFTLFALDGKPRYPAFGTPISNIQAGLNWESSGQAAGNWNEAYYTTVYPQDPSLARDLTAAVTMDVGRDGVPVVAMVDTFNLPNWQAGAATPHIRHAISIVGYDNAANPPTFTYTETCGRACNRRGGNQDGDIHVISQADMVLALQNQVGMGFVW